jgi:hypothetical protein
MLAGQKNKLTMRVLEKMRRQGAPKKVALISEMGDPEEDLGTESMEPIVESKQFDFKKKKSSSVA